MPKKVIRLTEADIDRIVKKILSEQFQTGVRKGEKIDTVTNTNELNVELPKKSFEAGKYEFNSLTPEAKKAINDSVAKLALFITNNPNTEVTMGIEVGESAVTNYDREICQEGDFSEGCKLPVGELAKKRGKTIMNFLNAQFKNFVDLGKIKTVPIIPEPTVGAQKHTYEKGKDNPKDPKYLEDQYIKFIVDLKSTTTEDVYAEDCLVGFVVDVSYKKDKSAEFPCRGGHRCDRAKFGVYLNETELGVANLNNQKDGRDRDARFVVDEAKWEEISRKMEQDGKDTITLWTKCLSDYCHTSVQEVKLTNEGASFEWNKCVNPQATRGDKSRSILAVLDKCGKVLSADVSNLDDVVEKSDSQDIVLQQSYVDIINNNGVMLRRYQDVTNIFAGRSNLKIADSSLNGDNLVMMVKNEGDPVKVSTNVIGDNKKTDITLPSNSKLKVVVPIKDLKIPSKQLESIVKQLNDIIEKDSGKRNPRLYKIKGSDLYYSRSALNLENSRLLGRDISIEPNTLFKVTPR